MRRAFSVSAMLMMAFAAHGGEPQRVVLDVPGMNCSLCPISVKKALERVPGVMAAKADLASKTAEATIDPERVRPEALSKAVSDAGYPATIRRP
jgi:periplasmic mercuric ion binding protein